MYDPFHQTYQLTKLRESFDLADLRTSTIYDRLGETSQRIVDLLLLNRSVFASELQLQTKEIEGVIVNQHAQTRAMIMEVVQKHDIKQSTSASYIRSMSSATESAFATTNEPECSLRKTLLDSLDFSSQ